MTPLAVGFVIGALWIIGLLIGLFALVMVVGLLRSIHAAARQIAADAGDAYNSADIMSGGVRGVDELAQTESLANQVPDLATAYLGKLNKPRGKS